MDQIFFAKGGEAVEAVKSERSILEIFQIILLFQTR